jgi:large subunit ribosomal protein L27Ae
MRHFHVKRNTTLCPSVNVDKLWALVGEEALATAQAAAKKGEAAVIDLAQFGIFKLLGKGDLPKLPVVVKARFVSRGAEAKIKAVGGAVVLTA